jgi:hypothetical protein
MKGESRTRPRGHARDLRWYQVFYRCASERQQFCVGEFQAGNCTDAIGFAMRKQQRDGLNVTDYVYEAKLR